MSDKKVFRIFKQAAGNNGLRGRWYMSGSQAGPIEFDNYKEAKAFADDLAKRWCNDPANKVAEYTVVRVRSSHRAGGEVQVYG